VDRVKGLGSFALVAVAVLIALRIVHLAVPLVFPSTRLGPIIVATMDEARDQLGFAPIVPTYRPASIGDKPIRITVVFSPTPHPHRRVAKRQRLPVPHAAARRPKAHRSARRGSAGRRRRFHVVDERAGSTT
jgi:hypothetical protein